MMFWKLGLVSVVTVLYMAQAVILFVTGDRPQSLIFGGYALANVGLIWSLL